MTDKKNNNNSSGNKISIQQIMKEGKRQNEIRQAKNIAGTSSQSNKSSKPK